MLVAVWWGYFRYRVYVVRVRASPECVRLLIRNEIFRDIVSTKATTVAAVDVTKGQQQLES